jgi:nitroreductase
MDVSTAINQRISTRAYLDKPITEAETREWLAAGQRAPSGGNLQPWRVIALAGEAKTAVADMAMKALMANPQGEPTDYPIYPKNLWNPHEERRQTIGRQMFETLGIPKDDKAARMAWFAGNFRFFDAPLAIFIVLDKRMGHGQWAHSGMFLQTLALLAEERGWATCMQECWGMLRPSLKAHLNLADGEMVWCAMAVGYPDKDAPVNTLRSERAAVDDFASFAGF